MTDVEKKLNREDLLAYKHFDNKQYALIPGINNQKRFIDPTIHPPKQRIDPNEAQKRMQLHGYTRE